MSDQDKPKRHILIPRCIPASEFQEFNRMFYIPTLGDPNYAGCRYGKAFVNHFFPTSTEGRGSSISQELFYITSREQALHIIHNELHLIDWEK